MKVSFYMLTEIEVKFDRLTLLSKEEYVDAMPDIPEWKGCWWLCSPCSLHEFAAYVSDTGSIGNRAVDHGSPAVRPVLVLSPESANFNVGDKFVFKRYHWTVISERYALCDVGICHMPFRKDWRAEDSNFYGVSDVKKYLDDLWMKWSAE